MQPVLFNCPMCGCVEFNILVKPNGVTVCFCTACDADVIQMDFDEEMYECALDSKEEAKKVLR